MDDNIFTLLCILELPYQCSTMVASLWFGVADVKSAGQTIASLASLRIVVDGVAGCADIL